MTGEHLLLELFDGPELSDEDRFILSSRLGLGGSEFAGQRRTLREVGNMLGCSPNRVRQKQLNALSKLRVACRRFLAADERGLLLDSIKVLVSQARKRGWIRDMTDAERKRAKKANGMSRNAAEFRYLYYR